MTEKFGFLTHTRKENPCISCEKRIENFEEFHIPLPYAARLEQAGRCMHCGVPFCQSAIEIGGMVTGCPLHNLIPEWNEELFAGNDEYALARLLKTNPFPEFTSRVCPALCEKACLNGVDSEATAIHDNENYLIEKGFSMGWVQPHIPETRTGRKVAVIGSGPAGLAAASLLNMRGHEVTVFEKSGRPGGLLMYGIPNMKLDKSVVMRRIDLMEQEGIRFVCHTEAGRDISREELEQEYDAIVLAAGSKKPRTLACLEGASGQVHFAVDYLSAQTEALLTGKKPAVTARNRHVVIVGGGDTGNDCVGTAIRQHAKSVTQLEMMPMPPLERQPDNPWPQWPKVAKFDYGQIEAAHVFGHDPRLYSTTIESLEEKNGKLHAVHTVQLDAHFQSVQGTQQTLRCDLLLIAAGFTGVEDSLKDGFSLQTGPRNTIVTLPGSFQTPQKGLFACGDCRRGQSLVVWAIAQGKDCAREVDRYLMGYTNID